MIRWVFGGEAGLTIGLNRLIGLAVAMRVETLTHCRKRKKMMSVVVVKMTSVDVVVTVVRLFEVVSKEFRCRQHHGYCRW